MMTNDASSSCYDDERNQEVVEISSVLNSHLSYAAQ